MNTPDSQRAVGNRDTGRQHNWPEDENAKQIKQAATATQRRRRSLNRLMEPTRQKWLRLLRYR